MKKVMYNKFTKLLLMVVVVVLTGTMLYQSFSMLERHYSFCEAWQAARDTTDLWEETPAEIINDHLDEVMCKLLTLYASEGFGGVLGLAESWENDSTTTSGLECFILITDGSNIYSNFIDESDVYELDKMSYVDHFSLERYMDMYYDPAYDWYPEISEDYSLQVNSVSGSVYDEDGDVVTLVHEEVAVKLETITTPVSIKIYLPEAYIDGIYAEYEYDHQLRFDYIYASYDSDMIGMFIPIVIEASCLIVVLIILTAILGVTVDGVKVLNKWDAKSMELHLLIIVALCVPIVMLINYICTNVDMDMKTNEWILPLLGESVRWTYVIVGTVAFTALFYEIGVLIKKKKAKRVLKDCVIVQVIRRLCRWLRSVYDSSAYAALPRIKKVYVRKIITDILVAVVCVVITVAIHISEQERIESFGIVYDWWYNNITGYGLFESPIVLYAVIWIPVIIYYINSFLEYRNLRKYNQVVKAIETIYRGNYNGVVIRDKEKNEALKMLANLSDSFEESVRKQVEAEKMQVELVANVSHDLKTPLTSIISYVDLLKEEEMSDVAKDYVKVLSDKSARLKDIVADVFDLAKATSGEEVPMEQLDGVVLVNQVLSDLHDKIEASGREMKVNITPESAPVVANGQKLYRVFQNIIDNALKYSMPGTRIYLTADLEGSEFVLVLKNVSEYEMNFTAEEVMSRFTRGDKARHSEGTGLGLSIAKSFTELMGGTFAVELDGDVFKTIVRLK